jgi:hypothetical protein
MKWLSSVAFSWKNLEKSVKLTKIRVEMPELRRTILWMLGL